MYQTTCPHSRAKRTKYTKPHANTHPVNCNFIPQKDSMIPYMTQTHHLLNNQVLAIFSSSTTITATLHYSGFENWPIFSAKYVIVYLHFLHFLQSGTHSVLVYFMDNITHSASFPPPPFPPLNHTSNLTHLLATIRSNNPFPSLCHSTNYGCIKDPISEWISWVLTLSWSFHASSKHGHRQMRSQSLIPQHSDSENWHITSSSLWRKYMWSKWQTVHSNQSHSLNPTITTTRLNPYLVISS